MCAYAYAFINISVYLSGHVIACTFPFFLFAQAKFKKKTGFQIIAAYLVLYKSGKEEVDLVHVIYFYTLGAYRLTMTRNSPVKLEII